MQTYVLSSHLITAISPRRYNYTEMLIDEKPIKFQIDCNSSINILPKDVVDKCDVATTTKTLIVWNKTEIPPLGTARMIVTNPKNRKKYSVEFVVVTGKLTPLVGARAAQHLKLLTIHWSNFKLVLAPKRNEGVVHQLLTVQQVATQYPRVSRAYSDVSQAWWRLKSTKMSIQSLHLQEEFPQH